MPPPYLPLPLFTGKLTALLPCCAANIQSITQLQSVWFRHFSNRANKPHIIFAHITSYKHEHHFHRTRPTSPPPHHHLTQNLQLLRSAPPTTRHCSLHLDHAPITAPAPNPRRIQKNLHQSLPARSLSLLFVCRSSILSPPS